MAIKTWDTKKSCGCPKIDLKHYNLSTHRWKTMLFYEVKMPLLSNSMNSMIKKMNKAFTEINNKNYNHNKEKHMILHEEDKLLKRGSILIQVAKANKKDKNIKILTNKNFITNTHKGHMIEVDNAILKLKEHSKNKGKEINSLYYWYTSCPHCSKKIGHLETVIFADIEKNKK